MVASSISVALVIVLMLFQRVQGASLVTLEHSLDGIRYEKAGAFELDGVRRYYVILVSIVLNYSSHFSRNTTAERYSSTHTRIFFV